MLRNVNHIETDRKLAYAYMCIIYRTIIMLKHNKLYKIN